MSDDIRKVGSDERATQARGLADLLDVDMDRERAANLLPHKLAKVKSRYDGHIDPEIRIRRAADGLREYANWIEQHGTGAQPDSAQEAVTEIMPDAAWLQAFNEQIAEMGLQGLYEKEFERIKKRAHELGAAHPPQPVTPVENGCICKGNWRAIIKGCQKLIGEIFSSRGNDYRFFGVVWAEDDFYYGMQRLHGDKRTALLSCVGSIEMYGYTLKQPVDAQGDDV